jgi:hypothetical protein
MMMIIIIIIIIIIINTSGSTIVKVQNFLSWENSHTYIRDFNYRIAATLHTLETRFVPGI